MEMNEARSVWQIYISRMFTFNYLWKKIALLLLGIIHDFTKYKICRTFSDLFYWPDGFCADTVVVVLFFLIGVLSICDDISPLLQEIAECYNEAKYLFKIASKLPSEDDDWD